MVCVCVIETESSYETMYCHVLKERGHWCSVVYRFFKGFTLCSFRGADISHSSSSVASGSHTLLICRYEKHTLLTQTRSCTVGLKVTMECNKWSKSAEFTIKSCALNEKLDQIIKGQLSRNNLHPAASPLVYLLSVVVGLWSRGQAWHLGLGENRLWHSSGELSPFILCRSVAAQGAVAYLVSDSNDTHTYTQSFSCLTLPCSCKKSSRQETKASNGRLWTLKQKLLGFTLSLH